MLSRTGLIAAGLQLLAAFPSASATLVNATESCVDVHFFIARGTTQSYPGWPYDAFNAAAENMTSTTSYEDIIYPATDETTSDSYFLGRAAVGHQVNAYAERCPDAKLVLGAYSQGCIIVGDALVGGGGQDYLGNVTKPEISKEVGERIIAILFYGNPRHIPYQSYDFGWVYGNPWNATGKYPRTKHQKKIFHKRYAAVTGDYCNYGDSVCSPTSDDFLVKHEAYSDDYDTYAAEWTFNKIGKYVHKKAFRD